MAPFFPPYYSKTEHMPNQANRSKDQSNIVKPKRKATKAATPNSNQEQSDKKGGDSSKANQGNKAASGSNPNE
jgi:hypothetical protein